MINFKEVELSDKQWMEPLITKADMGGCHQNFTNIFIWGKMDNKRVAKVNDFLVVKNGKNNDEQRYFYPAGLGDIKPVIEELMQDATDCGHKFMLAGVSPENIEVLNELYPGKFKYKKMRESFDYVYLLEKLVTLSGKKLHSKRNHINNFKRNNEWSFEEITSENIDECWKMNKQWCLDNGVEDNEDLSKEACAVRLCFENFEALQLEGGLIRANGKVVAYTMGEKLNSNTYVIHIEKAFGEIQGAYPMINAEFAAFIQEKYPEIIYVNREEDMGDPGLRKAKKSYYPEKMEEKYMAIYK